MATVAPHIEEAEPAIVTDEPPRAPWWHFPATTWAVAGAVLVWFVVFPAIVTGLIAVAIFGALGEKRQNDQNRIYRR